MQKEIFKYPLSSIGLRKQLSKGWTEADESPTLVGPSCNISKTDHLSYRPGEICSVASANRINRDRSICGRKASGSKVDGIFTIGKGRLEIAVIEMSRNFEEPTSTKALKDARKLGKVMKDMFDNIYLECNSEDDIMGKLEVFGLLMSGPRVEILSLRYLKGRFFRLKRECSLTIPPELTDDSIGEIMKTITRFLKLRVRMENMAKLVKHWKSCNSAKLKEVMLETECEANKTEHIKTLSAPKN
ncbi:hypothetical protein BGZ46_006970 [Entomortierella lignicola]|nr:hypothetical protein BGZ46_006970 [Entomortierella lignicola]